ncbi:DoxX family protein [Sphingobacterium sp. LRF_L2]|uniref:DoxX family protein n=1 Tax=Sphingobacterium sp. LRF_L2 TaxID=3369421 RepID=UPI003F6272FB
MTREISSLQHAGRVILGLFLLFAGIGHLTFARREFQAQVPDWIPLDKDNTVLLSGIVEIALALLILILGHKKRWIPWFMVLFLALVFPGNWSQYIHQRDGFGLNTDAARLIRLFFQPVLMLWALWSMGIIGSRKNQKSKIF